MTSKFKEGEKSFDAQFETTFQLASKGFSSDEIGFSKMLLGNMLGGIGYFHGTSIEDHSERSEIDEDEGDSEEMDDYFGTESSERQLPNPQEAGPFSLYTGVPSRSFFPRGLT